MDKIEIMARGIAGGASEIVDDDEVEIFKPDAQAALKALDDAGYAVVPKVPSEAMAEEGGMYHQSGPRGARGQTMEEYGRWRSGQAKDIYTAMIAAGEEL